MSASSIDPIFEAEGGHNLRSYAVLVDEKFELVPAYAVFRRSRKGGYSRVGYFWTTKHRQGLRKLVVIWHRGELSFLISPGLTTLREAEKFVELCKRIERNEELHPLRLSYPTMLLKMLFPRADFDELEFKEQGWYVLKGDKFVECR